MAARSVTLTKIQFTNANSPIRIRFGKRDYEFNDLAHMKGFVASQLSRETLESLMLAMLIERQPDINNPGQVEGKTMTVDMSVNNWGTIS
jgi:hypothetical protein